MKNINKIKNKYKGSWISVSRDYGNVYASAKSLKELIFKVEKMDKKEAMILKVPQESYGAYVG